MNVIKRVLRDVQRYYGYEPIRIRRWHDTLDKSQNYVVLDVGANEGQFAHDVLKEFRSVRLVCFEPLEVPYRELSRRFHNDKSVSALNVALGSSCGTVSFHESAFSPASSMLRMNHDSYTSFPLVREAQTIAVNQITLDSLERTWDSKDTVVLKLDVQGYELEVLRGAENLLKECVWVYCEVSFVSMYQRQPLAAEVIRYLDTRGFQMFGVYGGLYDPASGRQLQCDCLFRRVC